MNAKADQKETVGGSESMKEGNPIVPNEGTLEDFGTKLLETSWGKLKRKYYIYDGKLYVVYNDSWGSLVKERVQEVDLRFLAMDINLVKNSASGQIKIKWGWEE